MDAIALFSSQQWTICPDQGLFRLPRICEDVLQLEFSHGLTDWIYYLGIQIITGPMSLRVLSSRTVSIGDFDGSTGGGLTSVAPGILGVAIGKQAEATKSDG